MGGKFNTRIEDLRRDMRDHGFVFVRRNRHEVWTAPDGRVVVLTPKRYADPKAVAEIRRILNAQRGNPMENNRYVHLPGTAKGPDAVPTDLVSMAEASRIVGRHKTFARFLVQSGRLKVWLTRSTDRFGGKGHPARYVSLAAVQKLDAEIPHRTRRTTPEDDEPSEDPPAKVVMTPEARLRDHLLNVAILMQDLKYETITVQCSGKVHAVRKITEEFDL